MPLPVNSYLGKPGSPPSRQIYVCMFPSRSCLQLHLWEDSFNTCEAYQTQNFDWNIVSDKIMIHFGYRFLHLSRHWRYTIYYTGTYFVIQVYLVLVLIFCQAPNVAFHIPGWPKRRPCLVSSWRHMILPKFLITLGDRLINDLCGCWPVS